jgi:hypothetical protein
MKHRIATILLVLTASLVGTTVFAESGELDDTQQPAAQNILFAAEPEITALRERMQANREIMNGQLATQATLLFDRVRNEVRAVLTDQQGVTVEEHLGGRGKRGRYTLPDVKNI